jgi:hypothetical protein
VNNIEIVADIDSYGAPVAPLITAQDTDQYGDSLAHMITGTEDYTSATSGNIEGEVNLM